MIQLDKISKINIFIDYQVESFNELFYNCKCIESICFKKFYRNNVTDMSYMFYGCSSLKELNLNNFSYMFSGCSSLSDIKGLEKWKVSNGNNFSYMFYECSSLSNIKELEKWNVSKYLLKNIK